MTLYIHRAHTATGRAEIFFPIQWHQSKGTPTLVSLHIAACHLQVPAVPHAAHARPETVTNQSFSRCKRQRVSREIGTARWTHWSEHDLKASGKAKEKTQSCVYTAGKAWQAWCTLPRTAWMHSLPSTSNTHLLPVLSPKPCRTPQYLLSYLDCHLCFFAGVFLNFKTMHKNFTQWAMFSEVLSIQKYWALKQLSTLLLLSM